MKNIFKAASGILATIPGISVLTSGAMAPQDHSTLFGAFVEIVGVGTLLLVFLNQKTWAKTTAAASRFAIISGLSAFALLLAYTTAFNICVIKPPSRGATYFPLWTTGELKEEIRQAGSRRAFVEKWGEGRAELLIQRQPLTATVATTAILIVLICATTAALVLCFAVLAVHTNANNLTLGDHPPHSRPAIR